MPVVLSDSPAAERRVLQLIENLQREDLDPIEEARALKEIMRLESLTTEGVAGRAFRSQGYVDERLRLIRHEEVEEAVQALVVTKSAGAAIASLATAEERRAWLERARAGEVIRAREVYASKPQRRPRLAMGRAEAIGQASADAAPLPNFGNGAGQGPADGQAVTTGGLASPFGQSLDLKGPAADRALQEKRDHLAAPEARYLAAVEAELVAGDSDGASEQPFGMDPHDLADPAAVRPDALAWRVAGTDAPHPEAIIAAVLAEVPPEARIWVERMLSVGAMLGLSCAETLGHLRAGNAGRGA